MKTTASEYATPRLTAKDATRPRRSSSATHTALFASYLSTHPHPSPHPSPQPPPTQTQPQNHQASLSNPAPPHSCVLTLEQRFTHPRSFPPPRSTGLNFLPHLVDQEITSSVTVVSGGEGVEAVKGVWF